ncbi:MAG: MHYT domain-containing protein, partial [Gammaproteobacteria bacterium]
MFGEYLRFIHEAPDASLIYQGSYSPGLVALSVSIAVLASYAGFWMASLAEGVKERSVRNTLLSLGGFATGFGIWSMHFIGMLGFELACGITYDPLITSISMLPGLAAGIFAMHFVSRKQPTPGVLLTGGAVFGLGIGTMHYTGMAAMRIEGLIRYDPGVFSLSILVAAALATLALWFRFHSGRLFLTAGRAALPSAALIMGLATAGMHYTGMAAAYFLSDGDGQVPVTGVEPRQLAIGVTLATAVLTAIVVLVVLTET